LCDIASFSQQHRQQVRSAFLRAPANFVPEHDTEKVGYRFSEKIMLQEAPSRHAIQ